MVKNVTQIKSGTTINADMSAKIWKNVCKKKQKHFVSCYICTCENGKYLGNIIRDLVIICDEIIDPVRSETLATQAKSYDEVTKKFQQKVIYQKLSQQILKKER